MEEEGEHIDTSTDSLEETDSLESSASSSSYDSSEPIAVWPIVKRKTFCTTRNFLLLMLFSIILIGILFVFLVVAFYFFFCTGYSSVTAIPSESYKIGNGVANQAYQRDDGEYYSGDCYCVEDDQRRGAVAIGRSLGKVYKFVLAASIATSGYALMKRLLEECKETYVRECAEGSIDVVESENDIQQLEEEENKKIITYNCFGNCFPNYELDRNSIPEIKKYSDLCYGLSTEKNYEGTVNDQHKIEEDFLQLSHENCARSSFFEIKRLLSDAMRKEKSESENFFKKFKQVIVGKRPSDELIDLRNYLLFDTPLCVGKAKYTKYDDFKCIPV